MLREAIILVDRVLNGLLAAACTLLFLICLYASYDAFRVYYTALDRSALKYKPALGADASALKDLSEDAVGWLTLDDTEIDYPVMQGKNNTEYLNKNCFGEYSLSGSIFLDSRNAADFGDLYSMVYGHHMEYGAMFGSLDAYASKDYLNEHRTGTLLTTEGVGNRITLFASCKAPATEQVVFDPPESSNAELLGYLDQNAAVFDRELLDDDDRIIALSTCQGAEDIERMIVFGTLDAEEAAGERAMEETA